MHKCLNTDGLWFCLGVCLTVTNNKIYQAPKSFHRLSLFRENILYDKQCDVSFGFYIELIVKLMYFPLYLNL